MQAELLNSLDQFLDEYPGMSIAPYSGADVCLRGKFSFKAVLEGHEDIEDCYKLEIIVPQKYPQSVPKVREVGGKIPRTESFHVNEEDGSLCLGSPLNLLKQIYSNPSLSGFASKCLVPYLYAVSFKLNNGGGFVLGELSHGKQGIIEDYSQMFGLTDQDEIMLAIRLLGLKERIANKRPCPCGCGKRLGACSFRYKLNDFRKMAPVSWFKAHALNDLNWPSREKRLQLQTV